MMFNAQLPTSFWVDAFSSAVYIISRLPTQTLDGESPYELLFHKTPNYKTLRAYGCRVFPYLRDYADHKLAPRSLPCVFIGYSLIHKGYCCLDPSTNRVYISRHARFDESIFPFQGSSTTPNLSQLDLVAFQDDAPTPTPLATPTMPSATSPSVDQHQLSVDVIFHTSTPPISTPLPVHLFPSPHPSPSPSSASEDTSSSPVSPSSASPSSAASPPSAVSSVPTPPPLPSHPMITRGKAGIFKPRHFADFSHLVNQPLHHALHAASDPKTHKSAIKDPKWLDAMNKELDVLHKNQTWSLVPRPTNHHIVGSKWLFRTKYLSNGTIDRNKARLVAQGFSQYPGLDYSHTFSPVVKASTIRIIMTIDVLNNWKLHQLDVNKLFYMGT
ncbi:putative RNA-directed DNA polymerase [Helianthus debilis subsp. tardiflorus]